MAELSDEGKQRFRAAAQAFVDEHYGGDLAHAEADALAILARGPRSEEEDEMVAVVALL